MRTIIGAYGQQRNSRRPSVVRPEVGGMNADEVAQVVEASPPKDFLDRWASGSKKWGRRGEPVRAS